MNGATNPGASGRRPAAAVPGGTGDGPVLSTMIRVLTDPVGFYRDMPRSGGYAAPTRFVLAMGALTGLVRLALRLLGLGPDDSVIAGVIFLVLFPVFMLILTFLDAVLAFVIWKLMGSREGFETAYRCVSFSLACMPVAALVSGIPHLESLVLLLWGTVLTVIASVQVHGRSPALSWGMFGALALASGVFLLGMEFKARHPTATPDTVPEMRQGAGEPEGTAPEEAGKAVGDFLKGLQQMREPQGR